ncbi:MAG: ferritin-like domain-containing protein [Gammaproteobacteria bacterium]|nr:ferritin-like domain-containing protein [Gammaproteobacteria bacterium]
MRWTLDDIDWSRLEAARVPPDLLAAVKTAALVEANSADYVEYLHNVFQGDDAFCAAASRWGEEEAQHGAALGRWAMLVDADFDFAAALAHFRAHYRLPLEVSASVRGSRAGELLARCVVESGTCSYYSALRDATAEPVLRQICQRIAQDEAHHYRLFHTHYQRYPRPALWRRLQVALGRVVETGDDELGRAWYAANEAPRAAPPAYDRAACAGRYQAIVGTLYGRRHVHTAVHMIAGAIGARPGAPLTRWCGRLGWWWLQRAGRAHAASSTPAKAA